MTEGGRLYQLRTLINRRNITADPSKNVDACEDFIESVLHAHILCAAMESFGMTSIWMNLMMPSRRVMVIAF